MMLYEVYQVTQGWLDTKDKWDMNPMGDDPADLVWQKEMARITAGLSGSLIGGIVGSMVGAMMPLPGTTFLGGLVGGVGGYFAGDALFEASQAEDKPAKTKPKSQYQMKSGDVGGEYAAMAAYGPAYDNITVIQNTVTDASTTTSQSTNTNTSVNVGSPLQNRNYSATAVKRESSSPFTRRFNP